MMTLNALHPQESVHQPATSEVIGKFLFYMQVQRLALHVRHIAKLGIVLLYDLVKQGLFRPLDPIRRPEWCDFPGRDV